MDDLAPHLAGWTPEPVESAGHLDGWPSAAFAALLLLELPRRLVPERRVAAFSYRLHRPAFAGTPVAAAGDPAGEVSAGAPGLAPSATGTIHLG